MENQYKNEEELFEALKFNKDSFQYAYYKLKRDKDCVLRVMEYLGIDSEEFVVPHISRDLWRNTEFVLRARKYLGDKIFERALWMENKELSLEALKYLGDKVLDEISEKFWSDREFVFDVMEYVGKDVLKFVSLELWENEDFILDVINRIDKFLMSDKEFVLNFIERVGKSTAILKYVGNELLSDADVVIAALQKNEENILYAKADLSDEKVLRAYERLKLFSFDII